jgi:DNA-binding transcriptional LysR family regulator
VAAQTPARRGRGPFPAMGNGTPIYALWHKSRDLTPKVRVAVDALVEAFRSCGAWDKTTENSPQE